MRRLSLVAALAVAIATLSGGASFAAEPRAIPPDMIGMILTPTGFDGKIYESGQIDIGNVGWFADWGNKLVLLQRGGFAIKEQFIQNDPNNDKDREDHRCIVGPKREPMSLDVRLLFAMPDHTKPAGREAILRMGVLGKPVTAKSEQYGGNRVLVLNAGSVYFQQVQQQVRGKIRDICLSYESVDAVFDAIAKNGTPEGFTDKMKKMVGTILAENNSPLFLVTAIASNVKPDPSVISAIASGQAADKLTDAMQKIDTFIKADPTGQRAYIYKLMMMQAMTAKVGEKGGNNTFFMTDVGVPNGIPIPTR
ncbi:hypothetical protein A3B35_00230 [Candidatus Kaiserbacteria bacterium RIFCSPLOWO2_01_FULL_54_24]|uniref:Band 7 domain-containing protein n=1 Tax=Candidatus Kaiserbacteria bacterium RIFCSPLOWO2_01_FULL_54_24 TaxID=1798515 RepID=A0A1F6ETB2_9BACT|nr:MAG: hypothetical protein A3B35_00230 [Candidatus Kaiserbacteria bacterium RIFCSPLOWO2_01_FULL_54_24]